MVPLPLRACAAGTLPVALVASPCAGRGRLSASSLIRVPTSYCGHHAPAWASSQRRELRSRKEEELTRGAGQGSKRLKKDTRGRRPKKEKEDGGWTVGAEDIPLASRSARASTVRSLSIRRVGEVVVADSSLAPGFAATPTSPGPLRIHATAVALAWVTGVAILLLPSRLVQTSVTPMAMGRGTGSARWTRRGGRRGWEHVSPTVSSPTPCPGHAHSSSPKVQGTGSVTSVTATSLAAVGNDVTLQSP